MLDGWEGAGDNIAVEVNGKGERGITGLNGVGNIPLSAVGDAHEYTELSSVGGVGYPLFEPACDTVNGDFGEYEAAAAAAMAEAAIAVAAAMAWLDPEPGGGIKGGTGCGWRWGTVENGVNADSEDADEGVSVRADGWWLWLWNGTDKENAVVCVGGDIELLLDVTVGLEGAVFGWAWLLR